MSSRRLDRIAHHVLPIATNPVAAKEQRSAPPTRDVFPWFTTISTRWGDNDVYGHVNNVVFYSFFDTACNSFLIETGNLDMENGSTIGLVIESGCQYFAPIAFPQRVTAGVRVGHLGKSSVRYEVGIFKDNAQKASAYGYFVHVFVDRSTRRPVAIPTKLRSALVSLQRTDVDD